jgi:rubredoxin
MLKCKVCGHMFPEIIGYPVLCGRCLGRRGYVQMDVQMVWVHLY